ncbi:MAG: hydrolase [Proteobacteria bacterium]|nr:hydrolase [Pseudomonadota bacterium]MBI3496401.1 hydrolase [Pseudomonadota bacterium]
MIAILRRIVVGLGLVLAPGALAQSGSPALPIVFVHGNGDNAGLWHTTIWRFESNGYDPSLLIAVDMAAPQAPGDDTKSEENRSTSADQAAQLAAAVTRVLIQTGRDKVVLVGNSRGANTIRNYVKFGGGHTHVALVILGGGVNHGVYVATTSPNSEFNGGGTFMTRLNADGEVYPGVRFVTMRSDKSDKYAQPTGEFIGRPGQPTGVDYDAPALAGAENIVLPGLDHREVAFHARAFAVMYEAVLGRKPATTDIAPSPAPSLDGMVAGFANGASTNLPVPGASVEVFSVDPATGAREGAAAHRAITGFDGRWGPFAAKPDAYYEFVVDAPGYPTQHVYRTPFPRSSRTVHLHLKPIDPKLKDAAATVTISRPRGYFGEGRDTFTIDGKVPDGVNPGVPGTSIASMSFAQAGKPVAVVFNSEHMTVRAESPAAGQVAIAEFHY